MCKFRAIDKRKRKRMWEEVRIAEEKTKKVDYERRRAGGRCEVGGRLIREGTADDVRREGG